MSYNIDGPCAECGGLVMADSRGLDGVVGAFETALAEHKAKECVKRAPLPELNATEMDDKPKWLDT